MQLSVKCFDLLLLMSSPENLNICVLLPPSGKMKSSLSTVLVSYDLLV